jgi:siroheme synthase
MGLTKLHCLLEVMEKAGIGNIPLMIADRVSQEGERLIAATTDTILTRLESVQVQGPSLVVIGKYLETLEPNVLLDSLHQQLPTVEQPT